MSPDDVGSHGSGSGAVGRRFELISDDHAKFWEITRIDASVTVHFGRLGTRGQVQTKQFDSESAAMEHVAKLILEKRRKGYKEVGPTDTSSAAAGSPARPIGTQVPPDGPLLIGTVQLPAGHQVAHDSSFGEAAVPGAVLWISNEHLPNSGALLAASRRVDGTPWIAFLADDDSPGDGRPWDSGEFVPADTREIARSHPVNVLREMWNNSVPLTDDERDQMKEEMAPLGFAFPGLAPAGAAPLAAAAPTGFQRMFSKPPAPPSPWSQVETRLNKRIGVVAARRPADIITVIGWQGAVNVDGNVTSMSAVLRSWEDRFGATLVEIGFDTLALVVERPPQTLDHALAVAAEHYAFCYDNIMQGVGSIRAYASLLVGRQMWEFWWD